MECADLSALWSAATCRREARLGLFRTDRANKGVFITTSSFTSGAIEFVSLIEKIVLIDGARLAELMIECGVGVSHRLVKIPRIDSVYFEE